MEEGFFICLLKLHKFYNRRCFEAVSEYQFTPNEIVVLMFLSNNAPYDTATDIVNYKNISKSLVAKSVDSLCRKGYLTTVRDLKDRRIVHLCLSSKSDEIVNRLREFRRVFISETEKGIPEDYLEILEKTVLIVNNNLTQMMKGIETL